MKKAIKISVIICLMLLMQTSVCFASGFPDFGLKAPEIEKTLVDKLGGIIGVIQMVGGAVAIGACIYLGIRYILSSVEDKAEIKKKLIPLLIGVVLFYGATGVLKLIAEVAGWI